MEVSLKLKLVALAALAAISTAASAVQTVDFEQYQLMYDDSTSFGGISGAFGGGTTFGFNWNVPIGVSVASNGEGNVESTYTLPSFMVTPKAGYILSGPVTFFVGNFTFTEVGDASTQVLGSGTVGVQGGPSGTVSGSLERTVTVDGTGFTLGFHSGTLSTPATPIPSLLVTDASLTLVANASGQGSFASITAQPQNQLRVSFEITPVPEPQTWAMLAAGLGMVGFMARRRRV